MLAGLTDPEDLLLLHVDRMIHAPDGTVAKCQAALQVWMGSSVTSAWGPMHAHGCHTP